MVVDGVEFALAVEYASAGEVGHIEPTESSGQACRFFLAKG